jgi:hypothetical protein
MKTLRSFVVVAVAACAAVAAADDWTDPATGLRWAYRIVDDAATICNFYLYGRCGTSSSACIPALSPKPKGNLAVPAKLGGKPVKTIGEAAFSGSAKLESVVIPEGVVKLTGSAFLACESLSKVTIPESVEFIGPGTFNGCTSLASIEIPCKVRLIGDSSFWGCTALKKIVIPASVETIEGWAFFGCSSLESITFEGDAPKLWQEVFSGVSPNCTVFVRKGTKGWGVEIPGKWNGMKIAFSR